MPNVIKGFIDQMIMNGIVHVLCVVGCVCVCVTGSPERIEVIMDEVEKYITLQLYEQAFCPESVDDEVKDLAIQKRIRWDIRGHQWPVTHLFRQQI